MEKNPDKKYKAHTHLKPHHDAVFVVDKEGLPVLPNPQRLPHLIQHDYQGEHIEKVGGRDIRQGFAERVHTHTDKEIDNVGTVERDKEYLHCQSYRKRYLAKGNSMRDSKKQLPQTKRQHTPNKETVNLQHKGHFEEDEITPHRGFSVHSAAWTSSQAQVCVFVVQDKQTCPRNTRIKTRSTKSFSCIEALTTLEIRPQNLRNIIYGKSRAQQQYGKAKEMR